ncbi:MAG: RNA-binding domain-containing protein, partial [Elusimicrobiota bacterium]
MKKNQIIVKIIKKGESEIVEFKNNFDNETIETLVAFANTKGGKIFIGVTDGGRIAGAKIGNETTQQWLNEIKTKTQPALIPDVEIVEVSGKCVVVFDIQEYPVKPVSFRGRYYKRIKNSNHLIRIEEVVNLHLKTFNTSWDYYTDAMHSIKDISLEKVNKFIDLTNKNRDVKIVDDPLSVLRKFELLRKDGISQACFLLFMKDTSLLSSIEIGRFQTETLIKDSLRIRTDLFTEVEQILDFIKKHINKKYIITGNAQREE